MKKNLLLIVLLMTLIPLAGYSQNETSTQFTVAGVIVDATGEPLVGTAVYVKNEPGVGVVADLDGKFKIKVTKNATLIFQSVGMKNVEMLITKNEEKLKIVMKEDETKIDEVVVTGMSSQKKVSVVGAITTIDVAQLKTPATSLNNMIGGRMAGVITMQSSGEPGKNISNFWIRGISTFGASSGALVLIDGLEGRLEDIDTDDVESFSILKDAAATAVYGTRGANGVVLVTTKRGTSGKLEVTGRATMKISHIKRLPEYLGAYDYALLANEARAMSGEDDLYTRLELDLIKNRLDPDLYPDVNWIDEIMKRNSIQQNYYVSAKGGGDVARYFLSLGYQDEGAAYRQEENLFKKPLSVNKLNYRANIDMNLTKTTQLYFGVDGYVNSYVSPGGGNTDLVWSAVQQLTPLLFPVTYSDGTLPVYGGSRELASPYVMLNNTGYMQSEDNRNMLTLKLTQEFGGFLKGLTMSVQAMTEHIGYFSEYRRIWPDLYRATGRTAQGVLIKALRSAQSSMAYGSGENSYRQYYMEAKANWNRSFGDHTFGALLEYYMKDEKNSLWGKYDDLGITETHTGADNLKWEVAKKANLGIDAKFFHDKLSLTVDIFRDTRDHIFQDRVTLPSYVGMVTYPKSNVGRMHSVGSDGNIEFFHTINKDMSFTVRANYTFSQNIIDYFEENKLPYDYLSVTGRPFNILRGYISEGLFASKDEINTSPDQSGFGKIRPGDIKYRDVNGDGIINEDDKVPLSYSNQLPRVMYGFGGDFQWKDLTVSVLFKGSAKVDYYRAGLGNDNGWIPFYNGDLGNVIKLANNPKNRWTPAWYSGTTETENPNAEFPRLSYGGNKNNSQLSSFWRRNGSFLRLQEVSLRYSLKHLPWIKAVGLSSVDLEFVANNLCTFDNVKYFDPEQASANGAVYPIPATYSFQVYLRF